jgi:hypothetical protein
VVRERGGGRYEDDEQEDDFTVISGDDEDDEEYESPTLFAEGQRCDLCHREDGRVGIDPTCGGRYDGNPVLSCFGCLERALADEYHGVEGVAVIVEPFGDFREHHYYRIDEMPAYQFVREDVETMSWLMLTVGDDCARCRQQSRFAWLTPDFVDPRLPEGRQVFRNMDDDIEHLCGTCAAAELAEVYRSLDLPLLTAEVPRSAMGLLIPTGD